MSALRKNLGLGGITLTSIACCLSLPRIAAAGFSVAAFAWIGGIAIALATALTLLVIRIRRRHSCEISAPPTPRSPL